MNKCFSWSLVYLIGISGSASFQVSAAEIIGSLEALSQSPHIRTIASSCAACHGTQGNSTGITPSLAALDDGYFITQMLAFKDGSRPATVMHHHAKGLNVDEINLLAQYFASQKRITTTSPKPEKLQAAHE